MRGNRFGLAVLGVFLLLMVPVEAATYNPRFNSDRLNLPFEYTVNRPSADGTPLILNPDDIAYHIQLDADTYKANTRFEFPDSVTEVWVERHLYTSEKFDEEIRDYYRRQRSFWLQACVPIVLFLIL